MIDVATIETPLGTFELRPEGEGDAALLSRLFHDAHAPQLRQGGIPDALIDQLIELQHRSQSRTYRARFPDAAFSIIVWNGENIGRIVVDSRPGSVRIVDIALRREHQGRGLAAALLADLQRDWRRRGQEASATVAVTNHASRRLWQKLGFVERAADDVHVEVVLPLADLQRDWRRRGQEASATVAVTNHASRRLWQKLGFVERAADDVHVEVVLPLAEQRLAG